MSHRTRTTAMTIAAVAGLTAGLAAPAASASPITDFINSIGTGSAAPGTGAPTNTVEIQFRASTRGLVVSRGSVQGRDSCFTITDVHNFGQPVTDGYAVDRGYNLWKVAVDRSCVGDYGYTRVKFLNGAYGTPELVMVADAGRSPYAYCGAAEGCQPDIRDRNNFLIT